MQRANTLAGCTCSAGLMYICMVGPPRDLYQLARKGFNVTLTCLSCERRVTVETTLLIALFVRQRWHTTWPLPRRFRCARCGTRRVRVGITLAEARGAPDPSSPLHTTKPPPAGLPTKLWRWHTADERERQRMVRALR